tara:strand:+ start:28 stop:495 length:468 start_codon:yes stop_codon:yes gene_type:complete
MGATFKINWANYQQTSSQSSSDVSNQKFFFERPQKNMEQKIIKFNVSNKRVGVNSVSIGKPNPKLIRDPMLRRNDIYALEFFNKDNELIYKLGIGDPFMLRLQHIDMENEDHYGFEAPITNFEVVIPKNLDPSYVSLIKRNNENIYSEISRYSFN